MSICPLSPFSSFDSVSLKEIKRSFIGKATFGLGRWLVGKVLVQSQEPDFRFPEPIQMPGRCGSPPEIPALERQRQDSLVKVAS